MEPAREQLQKIVAKSSQAEVARTVGAYQQKVHWWCRGTTPDTYFQLMLEAAYDIPLEAWLSPQQLKNLLAVRTARADATVKAAREALERIQPRPPAPKRKPRGKAARAREGRRHAAASEPPASRRSERAQRRAGAADEAVDTRTLPLFPRNGDA